MKHIEDNLQIACVNYFNMQYPHFIIHHSANGGKRTIFMKGLKGKQLTYANAEKITLKDLENIIQSSEC